MSTVDGLLARFIDGIIIVYISGVLQAPPFLQMKVLPFIFLTFLLLHIGPF